MPALSRNLTIEQGTSWSHGFGVTIDGVPVDSTWAVRAQVRASARSEAILHEWTSPDGGAAITTVGGVAAVVLSVAPEESTAWVWSSGAYDVEVSKTGQTYRVAQGRVHVSAEVTR